VWICGTGRNARHWHDALVANNVEVRGFVELDTAKRKTHKRRLPVITYSELVSLQGDALVVTAISNPNARTALQTWLIDQGFICGKDFIVGG